MITIFEFLGNEAIENVITCLHFKVDKVIYFGYHDVIADLRKSTENFLQMYCGVQDIAFCSLPRNDLQSVTETMRKEIENEIEQGRKIYFDITGGESLILVAFGMLSKEYETPMHMYDVEKDKLIELNAVANTGIRTGAKPQSIKLNLDRYIKLKGGIINYGSHKNIKQKNTDEFEQDVAKIWEVAKKYVDYWNPFSEFLRNNMVPDENLQVSKRASTVINALNSSATKLKTIEKVNRIVDDLATEGILLDVEHANGIYRFRFKNQDIKDCIWEGGSILELHIYQIQKKVSDDCYVGVHLDWDGVIHPQPGVDVLNEVDVLSLNGNVPTFISCKSGKMGAQQVLHALYELETVAKRFGGKYAKKILVTAKGLGNTYLERAAEMEIEVRQL